MTRRNLRCAALLVAAVLLLSGCLGADEFSSPESLPPGAGDWPPMTSDVTIKDYKSGFEAEAIGGGYELVLSDELRTSYNPAGDDGPVYEYNYRPYTMENGIVRLLAYKYAYIPDGDNMSVYVGCEVSDFYEGRLIKTEVIEAQGLTHFVSRGLEYHEPATAYGWLDQNHVYLAGRSRIGVVSLLTGEITTPTPDPMSVYDMASNSHASAYMAVALEPFAMDGKLYYLSYRDPEALNIYGAVYEADINTERLIAPQADALLAVAGGALVYTQTPGDRNSPSETPVMQQLFCYDTLGTGPRAVFTDTWVELDGDFMTSDGVVLGNYWADKQEVYDNPQYIISERQLFFYVSRIGDMKVDRYVYDIATGNLLLQSTLPAQDYIRNAG